MGDRASADSLRWNLDLALDQHSADTSDLPGGASGLLMPVVCTKVLEPALAGRRTPGPRAAGRRGAQAPRRLAVGEGAGDGEADTGVRRDRRYRDDPHLFLSLVAEPRGNGRQAAEELGQAKLEGKYDERITTVLLKASRGPEPNRRSTRTVLKHLLDGGVVKPYL
jgi:hypothetical protein